MIPEYLFQEASEKAQEHVTLIGTLDMTSEEIGISYYNYFCGYLAAILVNQPVQLIYLGNDKRIDIEQLQLIHIN